jgi:polar amino acid transport system substrate-binding protein
VTEGKLTSVSDMANPPFSYYDTGSKEPKGFEVDLMAAVAEEMGLESVWLTGTKFDTIIPLIKQGGKADLGVANITITDERKQEINFSDPYIDSNLGVVTKADSTETTKEALNVSGKKIAARQERRARRGLRRISRMPRSSPSMTQYKRSRASRLASTMQPAQTCRS